MESIEPEGSLTLLGWAAVAAGVAAVLVLLYMWQKKREEQRRGELGQGPDSFSSDGPQ